MFHTETATRALAASMYDARLIVKAAQRSCRCIRVFALPAGMRLTEHGVVEGPLACGHRTRQSHGTSLLSNQPHTAQATSPPALG